MKPVVVRLWKFHPYTKFGHAQNCLENAFDGAIVTSSIKEFVGDPDVLLIVPRFIAAEATPTSELNGLLETAKGRIVQSFIWDGQVTSQVLPHIGRAHAFHVLSQWAAETLSPYPTTIIPLPVKDIYQYKEKGGMSYTVGGVLSDHSWENLGGWLELTKLLCKVGYDVVLVVDTPTTQHAGFHQLERAGATCLYRISDEEMVQFYQSLDWFVSLSVSECYSLSVYEALACGTPVIAPAHTWFLELENIPCVRLVNAKFAVGANYSLPNSIVYEPDIDEVLQIILLEKPPKVPKELPIPRWENWKAGWEKLKSEMESARKVYWVVEAPAAFVLYNDQLGGGLNTTARLWAKRTGSKTILYPHIPEGSKMPIIIPYHEAIPSVYQPHNFCSWLVRLREKVKGQVVIWMHHAPDFTSSVTSVLAQVADCYAYTHPKAPAIFSGLYLPLPIGDEPKSDAPQHGKFVTWGYNIPTWHYAKEIADLLGLPLLAVGSAHAQWSDDIVAHAVAVGNGWDSIIRPHLSDEELDEILDGAAGYIIVDLGGRGCEVSARIPSVLRKGKPIIASLTDRSEPFSSMLTLIYMPSVGSAGWAQFVAFQVNKIGIENLRPRNVPPVNEELKLFFNNFIGQVRAIKSQGI